MKAALNYLKNVRAEMTKVVWPKRDEVIKLTLIVIAISIVVALYVGALDLSFTKALEFVVGY